MDVRLHLTPQKCPHKCEEVFSELIACLLLLGLPCPATRPEILKHEMKVFFVKYNDPIYVKLEKLDIMIRLASQANIAQVLAELKEYATEVDVDFVRKAVRAIGRCAIKVEVRLWDSLQLG
ncbi:PREDICTED: AP-1 complex subunit beta-1-like, partial [Myotis brandtii]|uniref:AP-1 complex subunit beta-1-like n=1 Tax=Myotis brandtii TaxID=109478 RepID=UPI0007046F91